MVKDYIITITIDEYDLPLEKLTFTYWYALEEGNLISDLVNMAVEDCHKRLKKLGYTNEFNEDIIIYFHMITIKEVQ